MEIVENPDFQVFASEAKSGEVLSFPDVPRGWGISLDQTQGKPPLEWMNGAFKRVDLNNLYLLQQGLPAWNSAIKYPVNSIIKHLDKVYLCVKENMNSAPTGNSSDWVLYVKNATTTQKGIVQLTNTIDDSEDKAITPRAVLNATVGINQSWRDVKSQRSAGVTYTNNTGKPIWLSISTMPIPSTGGHLYVVVNGAIIGGPDSGTPQANTMPSLHASLLVPDGDSYLVKVSTNIRYWMELR